MQQVNKIEFWKERIDEAEDIHLSVYNCHNSLWEETNENHKKIIDKFVKGKVLDAGCGYGRLSELFDDYTGVDFSPDFIDKAKELYPDKKFLVENLKDLSFEDNEFDWAICVSIKGMIEHYESFEAWNKMEAELKRVANKVLLLEYTDSINYEII